MRALRAWLERVEVSDAIERRQALVLQVILLVVGASFLLAALSGAIPLGSGQ